MVTPTGGLKIVDFTWAAAGPITTRQFGDYSDADYKVLVEAGALQ